MLMPMPLPRTGYRSPLPSSLCGTRVTVEKRTDITYVGYHCQQLHISAGAMVSELQMSTAGWRGFYYELNGVVVYHENDR